MQVAGQGKVRVKDLLLLLILFGIEPGGVHLVQGVKEGPESLPQLLQRFFWSPPARAKCRWEAGLCKHRCLGVIKGKHTL